MNRKCAVAKCEMRYTGRSRDLNFFSFPKDDTLKKQWLKFCLQGKVENKINPNCSRVCMLHFKPDDFENSLQYEMGLAEKCFLRRGVVPSIKPSSKGNVELYKRRAARINKRERKKIVEALLKEHSTASKSIQPKNLVANEVDLLGETEASFDELFKEKMPRSKRRGREKIDASEDITLDAFNRLNNIDDSEVGLLDETEQAIMPDDLNENKSVILAENEVPLFQSIYIVEEKQNENNALDEDSNAIIDNLKAKLEILQKENRALRKREKKHNYDMRIVEEKMDKMEQEMESLQKQIEESNLQLANLKTTLRVYN